MDGIIWENLDDWLRLNDKVNRIKGVARKEPDICPHAASSDPQDLINLYVILSRAILEADAEFRGSGGDPPVYTPKLNQSHAVEVAQALEKHTDVKGIVGFHRPRGLFLRKNFWGYYSPFNHPKGAPVGGDTYFGMNMLSLAEILRTTERLEVDATGGVSTGDQMAQYLAMGAKGVQVQTAFMRYGYERGRKILNDFQKILEEGKLPTVGQFIGHAREMYGPELFDPSAQYKLVVNSERCIGCQDCVDFCMYNAISFDRSARTEPIVKPFDPATKEGCQVCGNCHDLCGQDVYTFKPV